ncbi:MAG TPA: c-type cytochrome [Blastocatellia bacterium]|nr:c-type cytochrome [Blastocatellia bacterium]
MESRPRPVKAIPRAFVFLFLAFALCLSSFDLSLGSRAAQPQSSQNLIEAGRRIYQGSCGMTYCHASGGIGGGGPKLRDREFSAEYLTHLITEGIPGTSMPAFKESLTNQQIAQCVAFILSLSPKKGAAKAKSDPPTQPQASQPQAQTIDSHPNGAAPKTEPAPPPTPEPVKSNVAINDSFDIRGDIEAGRSLFFDSAETRNCRVCHTTQNRGGHIGPDLSELTRRPPREIMQGIVAPHTAIDEKYATITITTRAGEKFTGVTRDEDTTIIRLYDTSTLPPVSRAFLKSEVAKTERLNTSAMPADYASKYSFKQLLDLVSFLKASSVSFKELF